MLLGNFRGGSSSKTHYSEPEMWNKLQAVDEKTLVSNLPKGIDTQLGAQWDGVDLSGGQWQRLTIARTLLKHAAIRIFDEPTSNVDSLAEKQIINELKKTGSDCITILVSYRAWTLKQVGMIYVFDSGHVVDSGSYDALRSTSKAFRDLFDYQLEKGGDKAEEA